MARIQRGPLDVTFHSLVPRADSPVPGRAVRLSFSGAVIEAGDLPQLGAVVELRLPVGQGKDGLGMFAEVKWLSSPSAGGPGLFGVFYLLPTAGRMLELIELHLEGQES